MAMKDEIEALLAAEEKQFKRQTKIAVIVYVVLEAIILAVFVYKVLQNR